ncbi:MAG: SUMF1/EgtB/PvdO family nonheme iron enzyme [Deltaproteobacteria bacterium]|nr:SUMF1/EgtB/PvdO family nonheme iron enzyme [Deltaproteobacteria bacterium]
MSQSLAGIALAALLVGTSACGQQVTPDATVDAHNTEILSAPEDAIEAMVPDVAEEDVWDAEDVSDASEDTHDEERGDVTTDTPEAGVACITPSDPRPDRTLRNCTGPTGAPAEHCREVWTCGGPTQIGSTSAWSETYRRGNVRQTLGCEVATVEVHPGFMDAYEVTVARFRAWVRAGWPQPAFNGRIWTEREGFWDIRRFDLPTYQCTAADRTCPAPDPTICTYTDLPSANDARPVNCVTAEMMLAFCWWEGKHLASEGIWESFASNGGRTALPFSDRLPVGSYDPCLYGDVSGCARVDQLPNEVTAYPLGQTANGVHGLWGGVRELTWSHPRNLDGCVTAGQPEGYNTWETTAIRGRSFGDTGESAMQHDHVATRETGTNLTLRNPHAGFRCARWMTEPWAEPP